MPRRVSHLAKFKQRTATCCRRTCRPQRPLLCVVWQWLAAAFATSYCTSRWDCCIAFQRNNHHHHRAHRSLKFHRPPYLTRRLKHSAETIITSNQPHPKIRQRLQNPVVFSTKGLSNNQQLHQTTSQNHSSNNETCSNNQLNLSSITTATTATANSTTVADLTVDYDSKVTSHQQKQQSYDPNHPDIAALSLIPERPVTHDHLTGTDKLVVSATILLGSLAFYFLIMASGPGAWRFYLSGGVCAATSHAIPTPIDVVKTRKQVDPSLRNKNFIEASAEIIQNEGIRALLAGLGPTTWGYLLEGAVKFGVYENLKPTLTRFVATVAGYSTLLSFMESQIVVLLLCGAVSGAAAAVAVCPMEALRIRMVAEPDFARKGWLEGGYKILKYEGVSGLWKGMTPMLYKQVPYTVMKNVSFDVLTKLFYALIRTGGHTINSATTFTIPFVSAMIASILSCISSQPGDMLLSLVNAHQGKRRTKDFAKDIMNSERGFFGFFVGVKTRLLHVGMIVTLQLLIYDFVKRLCGIAATGSV